VILSIIASAVLGTNMPTLKCGLLWQLAGITLYGIVIPGLIMTISLQQTIQRIGEYIRVFIEPRVPGLNWENRWRTHKLQRRLPRGLRGIGGIFYFLSLLPLLLPTFMLIQNAHNWPLILVLIPFTCWSLYLSYDMHIAVSKVGNGSGNLIQKNTYYQRCGLTIVSADSYRRDFQTLSKND